MTSIIIILVSIAAVFFCAFLAIRAWNRPKVERENTLQAQEITERRQNWFNFRMNRPKFWTSFWNRSKK